MKYAVPKEANRVLRTLQAAGFQAWAVGGCVRDMLLGRETKDWDFTTNATPEQIRALFPDSFYDNAYGTVGVPIHTLLPSTDSVSSPLPRKDIPVYEITTYRSESKYTDFRHPDSVVWGDSLEEDVKRRDFTVNALAFDGKTVVDVTHGREDLNARVIRAVLDPHTRFREDALRMMRAIRIATELQFAIENNTFQAIQTCASLIQNVSGERQRDELMKILASDYPYDGVLLLRTSGLLSFVLPEVEACFSVEQKSPKRHHVYDVGAHLLHSLRFCSSPHPLTRLATLLHDVGKPATYKKTEDGVITFYNHEIIGSSIVRAISRRLRFSKKDSDTLVRLVRYHQFTVDERQTDAAIRRFIRNVGVETLDEMLALRVGDRLGGGARESSWRLELFKKRISDVQKQPFRVTDLKVSGHDVMDIYGIGSGPLVGTVLAMLFDDVVAGKLTNVRDVLLSRIVALRDESRVAR